MKDEYGKLGHCEVVSLKIPKSSFSSFCELYFSLFDSNGDRPDQRGDRGGEYRSVVGIPGGSNSDLYPALLAAAEKSLVNVIIGKGNDNDSPRNTYVMDNKKYPFYLGEVRGGRSDKTKRKQFMCLNFPMTAQPYGNLTQPFNNQQTPFTSLSFSLYLSLSYTTSSTTVSRGVKTTPQATTT